MPGLYEVRARNDGLGRAGLMLPYTPTTGPLVIDEKNDLRFLQMSEAWWGDAANEEFAGCYTEGISDCSVIAIVEWRGTNWGAYYFEHLAGSTIGEYQRIAARDIALRDADRRQCWAVVGQYAGGAAFETARNFFQHLRIPEAQCSFYKSGFSGMSFGIRFDGGLFGEFNPWRG